MNFSRQNLLHWGKTLASYFLGQGATLLLQLVTGFILIRWLTKEAYATFTLVLAIQSMSAVLVELGISQSLTGVIGKNVADKGRVGRYIYACRYYRDRLLWAGGAILLLIFPLIAPQYGWTEGLWFWLWLSVVLALVSQAWGAVYQPILLLQQRLKTVYTINVSASLLRFLLIAVSHLFGILTAPVALIYGALQTVVSGWAIRRATKDDLTRPAKSEDLGPEKKEILSQALPRAPSSAFYAFEGQITVFLISIFGTTAGVAELGALTRLSLLLLVFKMAADMIVGPYVAKLDRKEVFGKSMFFIALAGLFFVLVSFVTKLFPSPLLLVLGEGYGHLHYEVFLVMAAGSLRVVTAILFNLCIARKYIYPWFSIAEVGPLALSMAIGIYIFDMSQLTGVLYYGFLMAVTKLATTTFVFVVGYCRKDR